MELSFIYSIIAKPRLVVNADVVECGLKSGAVNGSADNFLFPAGSYPTFGSIKP